MRNNFTRAVLRSCWKGLNAKIPYKARESLLIHRNAITHPEIPFLPWNKCSYSYYLRSYVASSTAYKSKYAQWESSVGKFPITLASTPFIYQFFPLLSLHNSTFFNH